MKPFDPYKVLKVRKTATAEAIKAAFRKRSLATHPDRGGSQEEFERVKLAWDVLSDPARRAKYDETGEWEKAPEKDNGQELAIISQAFLQVVQLLTVTGRGTKRNDVVREMIQAIEVTVRDAKQQMATVKRNLEEMRDIAARFETDDGANLLKMVAEQHVHAAQQQVAMLEKVVELNESAIAVIKLHRYRRDGAENNQGSVFQWRITAAAGT
jgi:curved DNA-binding protein CbpA